MPLGEGIRALGLVAIVAGCSPAEVGPREIHSAPESSPEARPPLVTIEVDRVDDEALARLTERLGPSSSLAGAEALLAVHHHIEDGWHIYWRNPGDSGLRTKLEVTTSSGRAGEVLFPGPDRFEAAGLVTYGWGHEVVLFVPLFELERDTTVELRESWLACMESCIPGEASQTVAPAKLAKAASPATRAMLARVPEPARDRVVGSWLDGALKLHAQPPGLRFIEFFPYLHDTAMLGRQLASESTFELHYRFAGPAPRDEGQGVLLVHIDGQPRWLEIALPWP